MSSSHAAASHLTLLVLTLAPVLEEDLIDYLLSLEQVEGFSSQTVYGYGEHGTLSVAEQVAGRQRRMQYSVLLPQTEIASLVGGLAARVGSDIRYWEQPIQGYGRVL